MGAGAGIMLLGTIAYRSLWLWLLFKGECRNTPASTHPSTPSPPRVNREMRRKLEEAKGIKRSGLRVEAPPHRPHSMTRRLPETSLHLTFPSQPGSASRTEQKARGQEGSMCLFPPHSGAGKAGLGVECGVRWMGSLLPQARWCHSSPPSEWGPCPAFPIGPPSCSPPRLCRPRTLVRSQSPPHQAPQCPFVDFKRFYTCGLGLP